MKPVQLALLTALMPGLSAQAANIGWVSFHTADNTPSGAAATAGFTQAPDVGYTTLLSGAGHTVTRVQTVDDASNSALLNTFDLVIISRSVPSGHYQQAGEQVFWNNTVTAPVMALGGYILRNTRLGYTTGGTMVDTVGSTKLTVEDTSHPIFAGIAFDSNKTMVNNYADIVTFQALTQLGISVNTDPLAGGGTRLASVSAGATAAPGGMIIAEWQAGATMGTAPATTLGGDRLVFLTGSRESGITSEGAGIMDLTADGRTMFLNAVDYMTAPVPEPASLSLVALGAAAILLRKRRD